MFAAPGLSRADRAGMLEAYKAALADSYKATASGHVWISPESKQLSKGVRPDRAAQVFDNITKSLTGDLAAQLGQDIEYLRSNMMPDLQKDWTLTNPVSDGLVPYDLEAPAKLLVPRYTPLRNTIPRIKGQGTARQFKRITSFTNSGQATAEQLPFFDSTTATTPFNGLALNRPQKINYSGDSKTVPYVELGFSDLVGWKAYFAGLGFDDLLSLSHTALLWSHLMGEERADLYARGGLTGYGGSVAAPTIAAANAGVGGTLAADTYHCYVVGKNGMGKTLASAVASTTTVGATSTITVDVTSEPDGAIFYDLYVGDGAAGFATARFQTQFIGNTVTITEFNAAGALGVDADTSFDNKAYDGFYSVLSDPAQAGYFKRINGDWSTTKPGSELETALVSMWTANGATPEEIHLTGLGAQSLGELTRVGGVSGASSGYRTLVQTGDGGVTIGTAVTGMVNPVTRDIVDINAHRFALPGTALIRSRTLPIQDSEVPAPTAKVNVQDYAAIDWPTIQMSKDTSTYQYGTLVHYAPGWSGLLVGVTNG